VPPRARISTFGTSLFHYYVVTEPMDSVSTSRVREGEIYAEKPQILTPQHLAQLAIEGFGPEAERFAEALSRSPGLVALLKYGFRIRKQDIKVADLHDPIEVVLGRVQDEVRALDNPLATVITGVDDAWEVGLLKVMIDTIRDSAGGNLDDFRGRGLL
jgi:hypothetical protein